MTSTPSASRSLRSSSGITRRNLLFTLLAAPAIVRASSLMPVRTPRPLFTVESEVNWVFGHDGLQPLLRMMDQHLKTVVETEFEGLTLISVNEYYSNREPIAFDFYQPLETSS